MEFGDIVRKRYAVKHFDGRQISQEKIDELFEMIRLAPSSFNIQSWKVVVIADTQMKEALAPASFNQKQITSCSHLLVFCARTDLESCANLLEKEMMESKIPPERVKGFIGMVRNYILPLDSAARLSWAQRQTYIALSHALLGAVSLGFDACPMEGFMAEEYSKILKLPAYFVPTALVTLGYASDTPTPKIRFKKEDVFI